MSLDLQIPCSALPCLEFGKTTLSHLLKLLGILNLTSLIPISCLWSDSFHDLSQVTESESLLSQACSNVFVPLAYIVVKSSVYLENSSYRANM